MAAAAVQTTELLRVQRVSKAYQKPDKSDLLVLDDVSVELNAGEIVALLGRSGSGKSTLLRIIAGLIAPTAGEVRYRGEAVHGPVAGMAMVFQSFALFPWLTVLENVEVGLDALGVGRAERRQRAVAAIDMIGLDGFESAYPRELSGGMRQRVGFARALVVQPDLLLMDEPFSALDVLTAELLRDDLLDLWRERRIPTQGILLVSHNIEETVLLADRIMILSSNPGRIVHMVPVALSRPRDRDSAGFRETVERIYALMTQRQPRQPVEAVGVAEERDTFDYHLPDAPVDQMDGLLDALADEPYRGRADLPGLAAAMAITVDQLFHLLEAVDMLGLARVAGGDVELTEWGRQYVQGDVLARKEFFTQHLAERVPLAAHIRERLDSQPNGQLDASDFLAEIVDVVGEEEARRVLDVVIEWGRYAELFSYDESAGVLSLENPGAA